MPDVVERVVAFAEPHEVLADVGDEAVGVRHVWVAHHRSRFAGQGRGDDPVADEGLRSGAWTEEVRRPPDGDLNASGVTRGHQVAGHRGADAPLAGVRVIAT